MNRKELLRDIMGLDKALDDFLGDLRTRASWDKSNIDDDGTVALPCGIGVLHRLGIAREQLGKHAPLLATPAPPVDETDRLRDMSEAPKDGRYILAQYKSLDGYAESLDGRAFVVRHEGTTPSGLDLGWGLFPGHGGVPDKCFFGWLPLPAALADRTQEGEVQQ